MQIISIIHKCLYFKLNKHKYLYGVSHTLAQDKSALKKLKIDHLVLPTIPYNQQNSVFLWQLELIFQIPCQSIVVLDLNTKKRLHTILKDMGHPSLNLVKWDYFQQHDIHEQLLLKSMQSEINKNLNNVQKSIHKWHNYESKQQILSMIVPEIGRTIILLNCNQTILIDPDNSIQQLLLYYGIPLSSLKAILLTTSSNMNIAELLMKLQSIVIITNESVYQEIKRNIKKYLLFDDQMIRKKVKGKIIIQQEKLHKFRNLQFSIKINKQKIPIYWDIIFGMKRIRIYHKQLEHYPVQITQLNCIEYLVLYDIQQKMKKQLELSPQVYRKRIIFNRISRKFNNKYFFTLNHGNQVIKIGIQEHLKQKNTNHLYQLSFLFKENDENGRLDYKIMKNNEKFNTNHRVVYIKHGFVIDNDGVIYGPNSIIKNTTEITCKDYSLIMYQTIKNVYFYQRYKQLTENLDKSKQLNV